MTYGNSIQHKIQNLIDSWVDLLTVNRKLTDDQMECMQFGICDNSPKQFEEVPYFHY